MTRGEMVSGQNQGLSRRRALRDRDVRTAGAPATSGPSRVLLVALAGCLAIAANTTPAPAASNAQGAPAELLKLVPEAAQAVCSGGPETAPVPSARKLTSDTFEARGGEGVMYEWRLPSGETMRVTRLTAKKLPGPLYFLDVYGRGEERRPLLRGVVTGRCKFMGGQDVLYSGDDPGRPYALQRLGPDMHPAKEPAPLNPPVPSGAGDQSCLRVAILDNGVNYLLPEIAPHLARDSHGRLVGHDYWENDDRPMDYGYQPRSLDPRVSPFSPRHHGTGVASVFLKEAPADACVAPYRYFPADEAGGDSDPIGMIDDMAAAGVKIVNLSSGRDKPWPEFRDAMRTHPEILFVLAAGNNGRDIAERPTYPAAYRLDNAIVVAATDSDGTLWKQSNRGAVDVAIMAVGVPGTVYDGSVKQLTGTSLAAPRVAAFAARLLAASPGMSPAALKKQILAHAKASGKEAAGIPVLTEKELKIP